jgi:hypothetical protein
MTLSKKEKITKAGHLLAGFIILLHGHERVEAHHTSAGILFIFAGLVFISVAIFHHRLVKYIRSADAIFALIEGVLSAIIAMEFIAAGKHYIQYMYVFAALMYLSLSIYYFVKPPVHSAH